MPASFETLFFPSRPSRQMAKETSLILDVDEVTGAPRLTAENAFGSESRNGLLCAGDPVNNTDPNGTDTYFGNRLIAGLPNWMPQSPYTTHTFVYTTNANGSLANTYSWGSNGWNGVWAQNFRTDVRAANGLIASGGGSWQGPASLDRYVQQAYDHVSGNPSHGNGLNNCKTEAISLVAIARFLQARGQGLIIGQVSGEPVYFGIPAQAAGGSVPGSHWDYGQGRYVTGYNAPLTSSQQTQMVIDWVNRPGAPNRAMPDFRGASPDQWDSDGNLVGVGGPSAFAASLSAWANEASASDKQAALWHAFHTPQFKSGGR
ncbi:MAG: hypothetical protein ACR2MW_06750 [Chthoniobacterales bacterium]